MNEVNQLRARLDLQTKIVAVQTIVIASILIIAAKPRTSPMTGRMRECCSTTMKEARTAASCGGHKNDKGIVLLDADGRVVKQLAP